MPIEAHGETTAEPRSKMNLAAPLMARTMRRQFADNWDHLRRALESRLS